MNTYTPGPWAKSKTNIIWSRDKSGSVIAISTRAADATLIASAPELYEELRWALEQLEILTDGYDKGSEYWPMWERIRAVLAKATKHQRK